MNSLFRLKVEKLPFQVFVIGEIEKGKIDTSKHGS